MFTFSWLWHCFGSWKLSKSWANWHGVKLTCIRNDMLTNEWNGKNNSWWNLINKIPLKQKVYPGLHNLSNFGNSTKDEDWNINNISQLLFLTTTKIPTFSLTFSPTIVSLVASQANVPPFSFPSTISLTNSLYTISWTTFGALFS